MIREKTIDEFIKSLASKEPVPGGGGASALGGAIGCSLGAMVGNLTLGKKKYADVQEGLKDLLFRTQCLTDELLVLIDKDAEAFLPLSKAYSLPNTTDKEKAYRDEVMEKVLYEACLVPVQIMEKAHEMICLQEEYADKGTRIAISDVAVGVQFLRSAILGASVNVYINTRSMKNRDTANDLNRHCDDLIDDGVKRADAVYNAVLKVIR
jgi:formiminotetrahydrofolate cyclodeaminase